jgi:hypothetical protein
VLVLGVATLVLVGWGINLAGDSPVENPAVGAASHPFRVATDYPSIQAAAMMGIAPDTMRKWGRKHAV